jgi:hypothetical protein
MSAIIVPRTFRVGVHLWVVVGVFAALFIGLGAMVYSKRGDGGFLAIAVGATVLACGMLATLRLRIDRQACTESGLFGSTTVRYADVARAYFEVTRAAKAPQGVAMFYLQPRGGVPVKLSLRVYPVQAAALLFAALEAQGIAIDVPDEWAAQRMEKQIRAAMRARPRTVC